MRTQHHRKPRHPRPVSLLTASERGLDAPDADDGLVPFPPREPRHLRHDPGRITRDREWTNIRGWRASDMPETPRDRRSASLK